MTADGLREIEIFSARSVVLASADVGLRRRLSAELTGLRWTVREANGGADAMAQVEMLRPEALLVDNWLPDLEASEFSEQMYRLFPKMDVIGLDGCPVQIASNSRSPRRHELLLAIREAQEQCQLVSFRSSATTNPTRLAPRGSIEGVTRAVKSQSDEAIAKEQQSFVPLPGLIGTSEPMQRLTRSIHLVAPRRTTVLIQGETGTGKEIVASSVHKLSTRADKPFAVLNCAAIPEALLEAELFGHTRGAFTGAVQSRTGRIEAANGGTLFLDEIGEMPLALQAKMLRFLECGELQRVGDNETTYVDVRVVAATHQDLERCTKEKTFRLDLFHRLSVFPLEVPPLRSRLEDMSALVEYFLADLGLEFPRKYLSEEAQIRLGSHDWPGNVRELRHVLERGAIHAASRRTIELEDLQMKACR